MDKTKRTPDEARENSELYGKKEHEAVTDPGKETEGRPKDPKRESINFDTTPDPDDAINKLWEMSKEDLDSLSDEEAQQLYDSASEETKENMQRIINEMKDFSNKFIEKNPLADTLKRLQSNFSNLESIQESINSFADALTPMLQSLQAFQKEKGELNPFLQKELKKPEYNGATPEDVAAYFNPFSGELWDFEGEPPAEWIEKHKITREQALKAWKTAKEEKEAIEIAAPKRVENIDYPLDKPNSFLWDLTIGEDTHGQLRFDLTSQKDRRDNKPHIYAIYSINFDDLEDDVTITKHLDPFDKRVYLAVSSLHNAGNRIITLRQIHFAMGNSNRPNKNQIDRIYKSIKKMSGARIYLDTQQEHERYKKMVHYRYDGSLLPCAFVTASVSNQLTDAAIKLQDEPPLITFARQRKQLSTINQELLQSPVSKSDANLAIEDYLLTRILREKHGNDTKCKILYKTLYERAGITTKMQKNRAPEKIEKYLKFYIDKSFLTRYSMGKDGITVYWDKKQA